MLRGFIMTAEMAEEFFKRCLEKEAVTEPERVAILTDLAREFTTEVATFETDKTEDEVVEELAKKANVYRVKRKPRGN